MKNPNVLIRRGSATLVGREFPIHLQVAFGRGVFRLLHTPLGNGLTYLRDLPLNLADLQSMGYGHALEAYRAECRRVELSKDLACFVF